MLAATAVAAAALIKYTSLVLLPVLMLDLLLRRDWRRLWILGIPLGVLAAWSLFNYLDYGGIHLLDRGATPEQPLALQASAWLICLGAVAPFTLFILPHLIRRQRGRAALALCLLCGLVSLLWSLRYRQVTLDQALLGAAFLANGVLAAGSCLYYLGRELGNQGFQHLCEEKRRSWILLAWFVGSAAFIILFAPFLAVRHLLPVLPVILLLLGRHILPVVGVGWRGVGLAATVTLGMALAVSDWVHADVYRAEAGKLASVWAAKGRLWYAGHWGWQWYASQAGMMQYDMNDHALREGDYVIIPEVVSCRIAPEDIHRLHRIDRVTMAAGPATTLRTITARPYGGYYYFGNGRLPWNIVDEPLEVFAVCVVGPPTPPARGKHASRPSISIATR